jgi:FKBP12-rapamycin complex-associated protein
MSGSHSEHSGGNNNTDAANNTANIAIIMNYDNNNVAASRPNGAASLAMSRVRERELLSLLGVEGVEHKPGALSERALKVIKRVQDKLTGMEWKNVMEQAGVEDQVDRLIIQATSNENLCTCFIGWCAFW